jgi:hypothetical protein
MFAKIRKVFYVFFIVLGLVFGVILIQRTQELRKAAKLPSETADVIIRLGDFDADKKLVKAEILFRTGGDNSDLNAISTIALKINVGETFIFDENKKVAREIVPNKFFVESDIWEYPINRIEREDGNNYIKLAAVNIDFEGYSSSEYDVLGTFYLLADEAESAEFVLDENVSDIYTKNRPIADILRKPADYKLKVVGTN